MGKQASPDSAPPTFHLHSSIGGVAGAYGGERENADRVHNAQCTANNDTFRKFYTAIKLCQNRQT